VISRRLALEVDGDRDLFVHWIEHMDWVTDE